LAVTATAALVFAASAQASSKNLSSNSRADQIGSAIAGMNLQVTGDNDWMEWAYLSESYDPMSILGFVSIHAPASSMFYHRIFVSPEFWPALEGAAMNGAANSGFDHYKTALAIFTLTHEAYHYLLMSGDEARVNACALRAFPSVLTTHFGISPTTTRTKTKLTRVRVSRSHWKTIHQRVTETVPNRLFDEFVTDVHAFYSAQPDPYSTGWCY
jgi:hypothetical protein